MKWVRVIVCVLVLATVVVPCSVTVIKTPQGISILGLDTCEKYHGFMHSGQNPAILSAPLEICYFCKVDILPEEEPGFSVLLLPKGIERPPRA